MVVASHYFWLDLHAAGGMGDTYGAPFQNVEIYWNVVPAFAPTTADVSTTSATSVTPIAASSATLELRITTSLLNLHSGPSLSSPALALVRLRRDCAADSHPRWLGSRYERAAPGLDRQPVDITCELM